MGLIRTKGLLSPEELRDMLLALPDGDRKVVISRPSDGQEEIVAIQRANDGTIEFECLKEPE